MTELDFKAWAKSVENLHWHEIIDAAEKEAAKWERWFEKAPRSESERIREAAGYVEDLKSLLFFLRSGLRPSGVDGHTLRAICDITHALVKRGDLLPSVLSQVCIEPRKL